MNRFYYERVIIEFPKGTRVHALSDPESTGTVRCVQRNPTRGIVGEVLVRWDASGITSITHPGYLAPLPKEPFYRSVD